MNERVQILFPYFFPIFFIGMWLVVTTILGITSGWFRLQQRFPSKKEVSRLTLKMLSGRMGLGVHMGGVLTLSACPSGLRVRMLRLFGPFGRPFMVPWEQVKAEPRTLFFLPSVRLSFGDPEVGNLTIDARLWQRLASQSSIPGSASELPPVSVKRAGYRMALLWFAVTTFAAAFFYLAPRATGQIGIPLAVCSIFPGVSFGTMMLVRFLQQIR